jgi:hypothetical protein
MGSTTTKVVEPEFKDKSFTLKDPVIRTLPVN